jgi:GTPase SAR1 family protein
MRREVNSDTAAKYASDQRLEYLEVSAKTGKNVRVLFEKLASNILRRIHSKDIDLTQNVRECVSTIGQRYQGLHCTCEESS